jgi:hypothetical protein
MCMYVREAKRDGDLSEMLGLETYVHSLQLPVEIRRKAPEPLKSPSLLRFSRGASYSENLLAVVKLVKVVLEDGAVVGAQGGFR